MGSPSDLLDTFDAFAMQDKESVVGWKLITKSILKAMIGLLEENKSKIKLIAFNPESLDNKIENLLSDEKVVLDLIFLATPEKHNIIIKAIPVFEEFLENCGFNTNDSVNISKRLPKLFCFCITK